MVPHRAGEVPPPALSGCEGYAGPQGPFKEALVAGDYAHELRVQQGEAGYLGERRTAGWPQSHQRFFQDGGYGVSRVARAGCCLGHDGQCLTCSCRSGHGQHSCSRPAASGLVQRLRRLGLYHDPEAGTTELQCLVGAQFEVSGRELKVVSTP